MHFAVKLSGWLFFFTAIAISLTLIRQVPSTAQEGSPVVVPASECGTPLNTFWFTASDACVGKPYGYVCNGGARPLVEPQGAVANSLATVGSLVEAKVVDAIRTASILPSGTNGGIAWMRVAVPDTLVQYEALMIGDVFLQDRTPQDANPELAWQSFTVVTTPPQSTCATAPRSSLVVQSLVTQPARMVINGASLDLRGTVIIQTDPELTTFSLIEGALDVIINGRQRSVVAGQAVSARYANGDFGTPIGEPFEPFPLEMARVDHLPVLLFDRPVRIAQGGVAITRSLINLRTEPSLEADVIRQVEGGTSVVVLGRNATAKWFHVRLPDGQTGWMWWELLDGALDNIGQVYTSTPTPLTRLGTGGTADTTRARVIAPRGTTLRTAPDASYQTVGMVDFGREVDIVARSPYNAWVKVQSDTPSGTLTGWLPLITIETEANFDAILVDNDVPAPLEPTRIPGAFGNAFPDPSCYPNCGP